MLYQFSQATSDGVMTLTVTFKLGTDVDKAQVQVQNRVSQALPKLPEEVQRLGVTTNKASPDLTMVVFVFSPDGRYDQTYLSQFRRAAHQGRAVAPRWRRRRAALRRRRLLDARLARPGQGRRARPDRRRRGGRHPRAERAGGRRAARARRRRPTAPISSSRSTPRAAWSTRTISRTSSSRPATDGADGAPARCRAGRAGLRQLRAARHAQQPHRGGHSDLPASRQQCDRRSPTRCAPRWRS